MLSRRLKAIQREAFLIRFRLAILSPPTAREREAFRRFAEFEDTAEDRLVLRRRGWARPSLKDGDILTPMGTAARDGVLNK